MAERCDITQMQLRAILNYDPSTGTFVWNVRTPDMFKNTGNRSPDWVCNWWNNRFAGKSAASFRKDGYARVKIFHKPYPAHRLAWLYVTGDWPPMEIDHIDGNPSNNRLENLRVANRSQNMGNIGVASNNSSGAKGVRWNNRCQKWVAQIGGGRRRIYLGVFTTIEEAKSEYNRSAIAYFGDFARLS